jgi:hypothetical protein
MARAIERLSTERPNGRIEVCGLVPRALLVTGGGALHETGAYREGWITLQDPAAQLAAIWLAPRAGERVLDACAGVGGKATHLAELAAGRAQIDAIDRSRDVPGRLGRTGHKVDGDPVVASPAPVESAVVADVAGAIGSDRGAVGPGPIGTAPASDRLASTIGVRRAPRISTTSTEPSRSAMGPSGKSSSLATSS